jgi:hypothetical protein
VHADILSSIRAGLRVPQLKPDAAPAAAPDAAVAQRPPVIPNKEPAALPAAKDEDFGLSVRRATRQRAKARIDAICDVVAHADLIVRESLKKLHLPSGLCDLIK